MQSNFTTVHANDLQTLNNLADMEENSDSGDEA